MYGPLLGDDLSRDAAVDTAGNPTPGDFVLLFRQRDLIGLPAASQDLASMLLAAPLRIASIAP